MHTQSRLSLFSIIFFGVCSHSVAQSNDSLQRASEHHLRNIRQLTFCGTNAEAYLSFDDSSVIFQSTRPPFSCDQIFTMNLDGSNQRLVSTGKGTTTCSYFYPDGQHILYSSTHGFNESCLPRPDKSRGYVWAVYNAYEIYRANADGSGLTPLATSPAYDAEATVSPKGDRIVFTSSRDGDLELYTMKLDGSDIKRITFEPGYDGGAFFSWNGKRLVYRANHPSDSTSLSEYKQLLGDQLVKPTRMEIFVCDTDGANRRQLTRNGAANFAPFFHPSDKQIIYSSNAGDPRGRIFQLHLMSDDGTSDDQVTYAGSFNAFPMFSRDGRKLVFVSNRNARSSYEFNVFVADWVE